MNSSRLILAIFLVFSSLAVAKDRIDRRENTDKFKKYKKRIEEQISSLPNLTNCDDKANNDADLLKCVRDNLNGFGKNDINKIEQVLELKTHRLIKSKKKQEIVSYLMSELEKKIHGKDTKNRKKRKYLSQLDYFTLHKNRLTKSTLMETASFCREKVVISDYCLASGCKAAPYDAASTSDPTKSSIFIKKKSKQELIDETDRLNQPGTNTTLAADFHLMCMSKIKELCNVYSKASIDEQEGSKKEFAEACLFKDRIAKFQKTINKTTQIEKELMNHQSDSGYSVNSAYGGSFDRDNIDKITNITSDFANDKKIQDTNVDIEQLKKDCEAGKKNENCTQYVDVMSQEEFEAIEYELKKKNAIQEVMIDELDDDKLKEFAKGYLSEADLAKGKIKEQLKEEFQAKKNAIIADIKKQVHGIKKNNIAVNDPNLIQKEKDEKKFEFKSSVDVDNVAIEIEEESNPNALRDNIFYSNLVNSYLERTNAKTGQKSSNYAFGEAEFNNEKKLVKDDKDIYFQQREKAKNYFEQQKKAGRSRGLASTEEGDLSGLGDIFNLVIFGTKK